MRSRTGELNGAGESLGQVRNSAARNLSRRGSLRLSLFCHSLAMSRLCALVLMLLTLSTHTLARNWTFAHVGVPLNASADTTEALQQVLFLIGDPINRLLNTAPPLWVYRTAGTHLGMVVVTEREGIAVGKFTPKTDRMRKIRDAALKDFQDEASLSIFLAWLLNVPHLEWHPYLSNEKHTELLMSMQGGEDPLEVDRQAFKSQLAEQFDTTVDILVGLVEKGMEEVKKPGRALEAEVIRETIQARWVLLFLPPLFRSLTEPAGMSTIARRTVFAVTPTSTAGTTSSNLSPTTLQTRISGSKRY